MFIPGISIAFQLEVINDTYLVVERIRIHWALGLIDSPYTGGSGQSHDCCTIFPYMICFQNIMTGILIGWKHISTSYCHMFYL